MTVTVKRVALGGVLLLAGLFLGKVFFKTILAAAVGGAAGGIAGALIAYFVFKEQIEEKVEEIMQASVPAMPDVKELLDGLIRVNIQVRTAGISMEIISLVEKIVDLYIEIVPQVLERNLNIEYVYKFEKLCQERIHKNIKEYLDMSEENRAAQYEQFIKDLEGVFNFGQRAQELIDKKEVDEYQIMSLFQGSTV